MIDFELQPTHHTLSNLSLPLTSLKHTNIHHTLYKFLSPKLTSSHPKHSKLTPVHNTTKLTNPRKHTLSEQAPQQPRKLKQETKIPNNKRNKGICSRFKSTFDEENERRGADAVDNIEVGDDWGSGDGGGFGGVEAVLNFKMDSLSGMMYV